MNKTTYNIIESIKTIAEKGVNEVYVGDIWKVDTVARKYPLIAMDFNNKPHIYTGGMTELNPSIFFVDIIEQDGSNTIETQSDMVEIMKHFVDYMDKNGEDLGFYFDKTQGTQINFQIFDDKWNDFVAGVRLEISVKMPDAGKGCKNIFI